MGSKNENGCWWWQGVIYFMFFKTRTLAFSFVTLAEMCVSFKQHYAVTSQRGIYYFAVAWLADRETGCRQDERWSRWRRGSGSLTKRRARWGRIAGCWCNKLASRLKIPSFRARTNEIRSLTALTWFSIALNHFYVPVLVGVCRLGHAHFIRLLAACMLQLRLIMKDEFWQNIFWKQNQNTWSFFMKRLYTVLQKKNGVIGTMFQAIQPAGSQKNTQKLNDTSYSGLVLCFFLSW